MPLAEAARLLGLTSNDQAADAPDRTDELIAELRARIAGLEVDKARLTDLLEKAQAALAARAEEPPTVLRSLRSRIASLVARR